MRLLVNPKIPREPVELEGVLSEVLAGKRAINAPLGLAQPGGAAVAWPSDKGTLSLQQRGATDVALRVKEQLDHHHFRHAAPAPEEVLCPGQPSSLQSSSQALHSQRCPYWPPARRRHLQNRARVRALSALTEHEYRIS